MELYETMLQYPAQRERIAGEIARFTLADGTAQVCGELAAILRRMHETQALAARPELTPELAAAAGASYALERQELAAIFTQICRALGTAGVTLSGGEISALKRLGLPDTLAAELAALRRAKISAIPAAERLGAADAAALYYGLARQGLISGPLAAFGYYLGELTSAGEKPAKNALSWAGTAALFSYFAWRFTIHTQPAALGYTIREKALCLAFGFSERQRLNVVRPYLSEMRQETKDSAEIDALSEMRQETRPHPKGSAEIDALFETLPSLNK